MSTQIIIRQVLEDWRERFESVDLPDPDKSIEEIVSNVIGKREITDAVKLRKLSDKELQQTEEYCKYRMLRIPFPYILGKWDFRDITLKMFPPVFIPEKQTESIVDFAMSKITPSTRKVLELGCGTGAIILSLAKMCKQINCVAVDRNINACILTRENANQLGLTDQVTVINAMLEDDGEMKLLKANTNFDLNNEKFDVIVSNPPYESPKRYEMLAMDKKLHEDYRAREAGQDGLKIIKPLLRYSSKSLRPNGHLFMEVDLGHPEAIADFVKQHPELKFKYERTYQDQRKTDRPFVRFVELLKLQ